MSKSAIAWVILIFVWHKRKLKIYSLGGLVSDSNKETESGPVIVEYTYLSPPNEAHMLFPVHWSDFGDLPIDDAVILWPN